MDIAIISAFREMCAEISQHHGKAVVLITRPVALHDQTKMTAVWMVKGINHGISVSRYSSFYELTAWAHKGNVNSVTFRFHIFSDKHLLRLAAQTVNLLPKGYFDKDL